MKKNTKKIATVTMTSAVLLAAPIAMNAAPMLSAQAVEAAVKTGWVKESGKWYFYKDGAKATGWQEWDGKRYYLNADGTMKANEWMIDADGSIYYFRSWGGAYKNCNAVINGRSYTFGADSKMQGSQWIVKGGNWYLTKDGKIATGWQEWQGSKYYLNSDGTMRSNEWRLDDSGKIRYLCSWGGAYKNRSAKINGRSYTFNSNADVTNTQWISLDGTWKLAKDGRIATGWQTWDKNLYYLNSDGSMKANEAFNGEMAVDTWIDGYYVDASGKWIKDPKNEEHTHKWVEETKTVNHPEESHIEIKHHDAVTHTVNHDEEFHYETVNHPEESHMETIHHEEVGHTVHHEAQTHTEYIEHPEVSHEELHYVCGLCGADMGDTQESVDEHIDYHTMRGESIGYAQKEVKVVDQAAWTEEKTVVDKEAWDEYVIDQEAWDEQVKVVDKEAWSEQVKVVDKKAWTETIIDKEAYDEKIKVIDKAAYDETIKQKVCSICGKIQK